MIVRQTPEPDHKYLESNDNSRKPMMSRHRGIANRRGPVTLALPLGPVASPICHIPFFSVPPQVHSGAGDVINGQLPVAERLNSGLTVSCQS
jgi:hypothetical protein